MSALRNTIQRQIVYDTVISMKNHPTADEIYDEICKKYNSFSKATVYRNLKLLSGQNKIKHIEIPNSADCYDFTLTNHYHIKCRKCCRVYDMDIPYLSDLDKKSSLKFEIESHNIVFNGTCPDCIK